MNPITIPTSPETRAALEKAGWNYMRTYFGGAEQWQCVDRETWVHVHPDGRLTGVEDVLRMMEFAAILGIAPNGYRIVPDPTAPNPHFDWAFSGARLLSPRPLEEGGSSPSLYDDPSDEQLRMYSEIISREPGFHQVNPINQRKAPALSADPLILLEVLYNCAVNNSRLSPEVERQIRHVLGLDGVAGPGEEETP